MRLITYKVQIPIKNTKGSNSWEKVKGFMPLNTLEIKTLKILHAIKYEGVMITKGGNRSPMYNKPFVPPQKYTTLYRGIFLSTNLW